MQREEKSGIEGILYRHKLSFYKDKIEYPRIVDPLGVVVGAIGATVVGQVTGGNPVAILKGYLAGHTAGVLLRTGFEHVGRYIRKISAPFYGAFGFNPQDFVVFTGFKKNINKELVTEAFELAQKPLEDSNDKETADILARAISGPKRQSPPYSQDELLLDPDKYLREFFKKDVLAVGGPIPLDPLYELMKNKDLPCSYELKDPLTYPPEETGDPSKTYYRYEILRRHKDPLIPEWDRLNWGIITCMEKSVILPKEAKGGLFFDISGCNWYGGRGSALFLHDKQNLRRLKEAVEEKIGKAKNFQAVIKVPVDPSTKTIISNQIEFLENEIYKIT